MKRFEEGKIPKFYFVNSEKMTIFAPENLKFILKIFL